MVARQGNDVPRSLWVGERDDVTTSAALLAGEREEGHAPADGTRTLSGGSLTYHIKSTVSGGDPAIQSPERDGCDCLDAYGIFPEYGDSLVRCVHFGDKTLALIVQEVSMYVQREACYCAGDDSCDCDTVEWFGQKPEHTEADALAAFYAAEEALLRGGA
jgi:hypothetical protein